MVTAPPSTTSTRSSYGSRARSQGVAPETIGRGRPNAQAIQHRVRIPRQQAIRGRQIVLCDLVIPRHDVQDEELPRVRRLYLCAELLFIQLASSATDLLGGVARVRHGIDLRCRL